ncbi:MAG: hypothetical protein DRP45_10620 [Candidatus Zixiibacteriota bacterium]|nr:MAG: hypothetical protein DRP45_10620 [candidate division Zixibacteria bacterium]
MKLLRVSAALVLLLLISSVAAIDETVKASLPDGTTIDAPQIQVGPIIEPVLKLGDKATYTGNLRIYVIELDNSRWGYFRPLLSFAVNTDVTIPDNEAWTDSYLWNAPSFASDCTEDNIAAVAVLFADGTDYAEAAFSTMPGQPLAYSPDPAYTHTVFVEFGSATW